jgi:phosphatidylinositol-3,4,5-trisphosphate 3-phosphatase/dual-specificity protein phosphatase PTEN
VSKKKRRLQETTAHGDVDLDFTVVHKQLVCMGLPADGVEAWYRNPYRDVLDYLDLSFGDKYFVYNLCSEAEHMYPTDRFHGRVANFPFPDHHACPLAMLPAFIAHALGFLSGDPDRVVVVHCKAGKGRTGLMACCLLMHLDPRLASPSDAIAYYGRARTSDGRGLTIPSQIRYVEYYGQLRHAAGGSVPKEAPVMEFSALHLRGFAGEFEVVEFVFGEAKSPSATMVILLLEDAKSRDHNTRLGVSWAATEEGISVDVVNCSMLRHVQGDVRINFKHSPEDKKWVGALTFHTLFLKRSYHISEMDRIWKKAGDFPQDAALSLDYMERMTTIA